MKEIPTRAWVMYSWGVQAASGHPRHDHDRRMRDPYYRYGFTHPVPAGGYAIWKTYLTINWRKVLDAEEAGEAVR